LYFQRNPIKILNVVERIGTREKQGKMGKIIEEMRARRGQLA